MTDGEAPTEETPAADDRRVEDRAAIRLRVDYKKLNSFFADYTRNISKGGTFIRTTKPLDLGTQFVFVLTVPAPNKADGEVERIELEGVVRWVVLEGGPEGTAPGMGIEFVFDDDNRRKTVEDTVTRLMGEALGPRLASKLLGG